LARPGGGPILHNIRNGAVQVQPGLISGVVLLQGRANHSGATVSLTREPCQPAAVALSGLPSAVTNAQGRFEITITSAGDYMCLHAVRAGYLVGQKNAPQGNVGTITLLGGDVVSDGTIDIFDLSRVAARYGSNDSTGDVNGDGVVDIFDLTLVAGNFGQSGPVVNWR